MQIRTVLIIKMMLAIAFTFAATSNAQEAVTRICTIHCAVEVWASPVQHKKPEKKKTWFDFWSPKEKEASQGVTLYRTGETENGRDITIEYPTPDDISIDSDSAAVEHLVESCKTIQAEKLAKVVTELDRKKVFTIYIMPQNDQGEFCGPISK